MARMEEAQRFAERVVDGLDHAGRAERIVIWIERRPGAVWAVGRAVDLEHRRSGRPRPDEFLFEGYELDDALEAANGALRDDLRVSADVGRRAEVAEFERDELLRPLERWFFGHTSDAR